MAKAMRPWLIVCGLTACAPRPADVPSPSGAAVVPRHPDQVCAEAPSGPPALRFSELFDTLGLASLVREARAGISPTRPPWPRYDFIVRYDALGVPVATGAWEPDIDPAVAERLGRELAGRARPQPGLLEPVGFRVRVSFPPRPTWTVVPPVECLPHLVHSGGQRPTGLPAGVSTWAGPMPVREDDLTGAVLRIHVDRTGRVTAVEGLRGAPATLARARDVIDRLKFDPALRNGVPVDGALVQSFRFADAPDRR